jgi:hypothetical protein
MHHDTRESDRPINSPLLQTRVNMSHNTSGGHCSMAAIAIKSADIQHTMLRATKEASCARYSRRKSWRMNHSDYK